ncbi:iron-sulfur cluster repair di-iron protein [Alkalibacillus aidingensis]|uniref:iron-sulfur cluster repair di-iron protein n=1 Tax=Alkalibacillus aidingensis TaxID=2747607 RepID=UPI001CB75A77|nr:iron-sulfur cluster repair di-iron protein [Alkalibacillus aidingensis]
MQFTVDTKTGDIVTQFPKASSIFKQYQIDFCCGGNRPIGEALDELELDREKVLKEINDLYQGANTEEDTDWTQKSNSELVNHIVSEHHDHLRQVLPEISAYVTKVYHVHGGNHPELTTIYTAFHQLKQELESHLYQEEKALFPVIKNYREEGSLDKEEIAQTIRELEDDHDHSGDLLKQMREATQGYRIPDGACNTFQLTYLKLDELESDMFQHIHLENNILFPRFLDETAS